MPSNPPVDDIIAKQTPTRPFTINELIVFALAHMDDGNLRQIYEWIVTWFHHYLTTNEHATPRTTRLALGTPGKKKVYASEVRNIIQGALGQLGMPIICEPGAPDVRVYRLHPPAAREFIDRMRKRSEIKKVEFLFQLPLELRNIVLEMVMDFPKEGIAILRAKGSVAKVYRHDANKTMFSEHQTFWRGINMAEYLKSAPPLSQYLAIFRVNKQLYREAMPVFYNNTQFVCWDLRHLGLFLENTPQGRLCEVRKLSLVLDPRERFWHKGGAPLRTLWSFQKLVDMGLLHVDIDLDEKYWRRQKKRDGSPKYPNLLSVPAVSELRRVRGLLSVNVQGDDDEVRDTLVRDMKRDRAVEETTRAD